MKIIEAEIIAIDDKRFIQINCEPAIAIPISDNDANSVKSAFNSLVNQLRMGVFEIQLKNTEQDLFCQIATEYLKQLNDEIKDVYEEIIKYGFSQPIDKN